MRMQRIDYRCEYKELIDKGVCNKEFIWNPSNCECEYDKLCDIGEYLNYDKVVEECMENVDESKVTETTENKHKSSCTIYVVIIAINFTICIGIGTYFVYSHWYLKNDNTRVMLDTRTETTIY